MIGLLKSNISLKVISILFAVVLWIVLNPITPVEFSVPLNVINESSLAEKGLVLKSRNFPKYVTITASGRFSNIKASDFEVELDLSKVNSTSDKTLEINPPVYMGSEKLAAGEVEYKPKTVQLDIGRVEEDTFRIELETEGKLKDGYEIIAKSTSPEVVTLKGIDSLISSVASVKAVVNVTGLNQNMDIKTECKVFNENGEEIPELGRGLSSQVKIDVAKRVFVKPKVKGIPAKNYILGQVTVNPDNVLVTGNPDILSKLGEISVDAVDAENASNNLKLTRPLVLPDGVKLYDSPKSVTVTVEIEQLAQKELKVLNNDISVINMEIDNSLKYEILTDSLSVSIKGSQKDLDKMTTAQLKANIDVAGLKEGTHKLPLKIDLPEDVRLMQDYEIEVKVSLR